MEKTTPTTKIPLKGWLILGISLLAISSAAVIIRLAQEQHVSSLVIATGRLLVAAVVLTPLTLQNYRQNIQQLTKNDLLLAILSSIFLAIHFAAWVTSLEYSNVLVSVVFVSSSPLWVALLEFFFLGERFTVPLGLGLLIAIIGAVIIGTSGISSASSTIDRDLLLGSILSLLGAVAVAIYLVIGRKLRAKLPLVPYIWLVYGLAAISLLIVLLLTSTPILGYSEIGYWWVLALGLFPQLVGHSAVNYALGFMSATFVSIITYLEPLGSAIFAFLLFQEYPTNQQLLGSVIILIGVIIVSFGQLIFQSTRKRFAQ